MKRQVVIIKGKSYNDNQQQNFDDFGDRYADYFKSNAGGAFDDWEIASLTEPSVADIQQLLTKSDVDYAVLVLIGHGATQDGKQIFHLREKDIIQPGQIELSTKKQLVIVESCRSLQANVPIKAVNNQVPKFKSGGVIRIALTKEKAKALHIEQVVGCKDGLVICFACDEEEKASSYRFSHTLLEKAKAWSNGTAGTKAILPITALMRAVTTDLVNQTKSTPKSQTPEIKGDIPFPFAVSKY